MERRAGTLRRGGSGDADSAVCVVLGTIANDNINAMNLVCEVSESLGGGGRRKRKEEADL